MKLKFFIWIFLMVSFGDIYSQELKVVGVGNAFLTNGQKICYGQLVSINNELEVKKDGYLCLRNTTGWEFTLKEGWYNLDSCYSSQKRIHARYDRVKTVFDSLFPLEKTMPFETQLPLGNRYHESDAFIREIEILNINEIGSLVMLQKSDTITLNWKDTKRDVKRYFIVIETLFNDRIDYLISNHKSIVLNFKNYSHLIESDEDILIWCVSEDGRRSSKVLIRRK